MVNKPTQSGEWCLIPYLKYREQLLHNLLTSQSRTFSINAGMAPAIGAHAPLLPNHDKQQAKPASISGAVFNVATSIIGAGIMSIPATLKVLGVIPAFMLIVIVGLLVDISVEFLMRFTHSGDATTYGGVMKESFGQVGSVATQICVMITNFGCLIMYLIIIGKLIKVLVFGFRHMLTLTFDSEYEVNFVSFCSQPLISRV